MDYPRGPRAKEPNDLSAEVYKNLVMDYLEDLSCLRLRALENIEANKLRIAKYYNKKVKIKQFSEGDLVWKVKLRIGSKDSKFSKWSPNWEGPYQIQRCAPGNAYIFETLREEKEFRQSNQMENI